MFIVTFQNKRGGQEFGRGSFDLLIAMEEAHTLAKRFADVKVTNLADRAVVFQSTQAEG